MPRHQDNLAIRNQESAISNRPCVALCWVLALLLAGCTSAVQSGQSTLLEGDDLIRVTDDMAAKIAGSPDVQEAIRRQGPLRVVVQPAENHMRAEVLPTGAREAFTARIRTLLAKQARGQFVWLMNRQEFYDIRRRELEAKDPTLDLGPSPDRVEPQYMLTARFYSMTQENWQARSTTYLCVFELTDLQQRTKLWTDKYEIKKAAAKGFLE
jgi:hypothetical protein